MLYLCNINTFTYYFNIFTHLFHESIYSDCQLIIKSDLCFMRPTKIIRCSSYYINCKITFYINLAHITKYHMYLYIIHIYFLKYFINKSYLKYFYYIGIYKDV